jgi:hypothetical protein
MKKRIMICLIVITLVASLSIHAFATSPRGIAIIPNLTFSGTTANCSVNVIGNNLTDKIEAEIKLWEGSRCLKTWTASATGYLVFGDTYSVSRNREYTLTVTVEINDISQGSHSVSRRCD